jgi:L-ascorbate metabolism protein UlaG (beta-lactamase superfamily)
MSYDVTITYLDTAMALIEAGSIRLLTDPVLDEAGAAFDHGPVHLEKTGGRSAAPETLGAVDAVLLSHDQHADNLDDGGRAFLATAPLVLTTPEAASRLDGVRAKGLADWESFTLTGRDGDRWRITAVPAQHGPDGTQEATGPVTGFMIEPEAASGPPIYVSGDTVPFAGTREIARRYAPVGLALLNLGRVQLAPMGDLVFSMSAEDAARFGEELRAGIVAPLHFEGWRHFTQNRDAAEAAFAASPIAGRVAWLSAGVARSFTL